MKELVLESLDDTKRLADTIAEVIDGPICLCLKGDLGAGKTTFTQFLGKSLGVEEPITSPTFQIMKLYETDKGTLCHIDAYRLEGIVQDLGFEEEIEDSISVVEWFDYLDYVLPTNRIVMEFSFDGEKRIVKIDGVGEKEMKIVEVIK